MRVELESALAEFERSLSAQSSDIVALEAQRRVEVDISRLDSGTAAAATRWFAKGGVSSSPAAPKAPTAPAPDTSARSIQKTSPRFAAIPMIRVALDRALSLDEQLEALTLGSSVRNHEIYRRIWGLSEKAVPTLSDLGEEMGITRERVRQLVRRRETMLSEAGIRISLGERVAGLIRDHGGAMTDADLRRALEAVCVIASNTALRALERVSEFGVVDMVSFQERLGVWISSPRDGGVDPAGLADSLSDLKRRLLRELHHVGAIHISTLDDASPLGRMHALETLFGADQQWVESGGFLVPSDWPRSHLARHIGMMLAVAPELSIASLRRGAKRPIVNAVELSDADLRAILAASPSYIVQGEMVRSSKPQSMVKWLRPLDRSLIKTAQQNSGIVSFDTIKRVLRLADRPLSIAIHVARVPYLRKVSRGVYELRGWHSTHGRAASQSGLASDILRQ
jgi:hypothetical protein